MLYSTHKQISLTRARVYIGSKVLASTRQRGPAGKYCFRPFTLLANSLFRCVEEKCLGQYCRKIGNAKGFAYLCISEPI